MYYLLRRRLTKTDMHRNSLLDFIDIVESSLHIYAKRLNFHYIKYILSMNIAQDDGDNDYFLGHQRIMSIFATLIHFNGI